MIAMQFINKISLKVKLVLLYLLISIFGVLVSIHIQYASGNKTASGLYMDYIPLIVVGVMILLSRTNIKTLMITHSGRIYFLLTALLAAGTLLPNQDNTYLYFQNLSTLLIPALFLLVYQIKPHGFRKISLIFCLTLIPAVISFLNNQLIVAGVLFVLPCIGIYISINEEDRRKQNNLFLSGLIVLGVVVCFFAITWRMPAIYYWDKLTNLFNADLNYDKYCVNEILSNLKLIGAGTNFNHTATLISESRWIRDYKLSYLMGQWGIGAGILLAVLCTLLILFLFRAAKDEKPGRATDYYFTLSIALQFTLQIVLYFLSNTGVLVTGTAILFPMFHHNPANLIICAILLSNVGGLDQENRRIDQIA